MNTQTWNRENAQVRFSNKKNTEDLLYLIRCALTESVPDSMQLSAMNLQAVHELAGQHSLTSITYFAIANAKAWRRDARISEEDRNCLKVWSEEQGRAIRKSILMETERTKLCAFMESEGIWYMPLKGILIKDLYPQIGMRQMADYDILVDVHGCEKIRDYFLEAGFSCTNYGNDNEDTYRKDPFYNFEIHRLLFSAGCKETYRNYYANVKDRLQPVKEAGMEYRFTAEDCYLYFVAHAMKHYGNGGTGLRTLVDFYLYNKKLREDISFNWNYVQEEAVKLGISDFRDMSEDLANHMFTGNGLLTDKDWKALAYFVESGTYGTISNFVSNSLEEQTEGRKMSVFDKLVYIWKRLFPGVRYLKDSYPICRTHPVSIPYIWAKRLVVALRRKGRVSAELTAIRRKK